MTVLEHLIGEMKMRGGYKDRSVCNFVNFHQTGTWCDSNCGDCKLSNQLTVLEYLNEEYKEPIEVTRLEYDILATYVDVQHYYKNRPIYNALFVELQRKGYFKGIDLNLTYKEVLERAEIIDDK